MPSTYPATLDSFATNKQDDVDTVTGVDAGTTTNVGDHAAHHNNLADAVNKIEAELGANPRGLYAATVRERFEISAYKNQSCAAATTGNFAATYANGTAGVGATLTASAVGVTTLDGYTILLNDRVLVKNQTTPAQNGIYTVTTLGTASVATVLTRTIDADTPAKIADMKVLVDQGVANGDTEWYQAATSPTIGTTSLYFRRTTPFYGVGNPRNQWVPGFTLTSAPSIGETMPRQFATASMTPAAATAVQYMIGGITVPAGRTVTNVNVIHTSAGATISVYWFALARQSDRLVMGHTANDTTLPTANVVRTKALAAAWTPIEDTPVWVIWSLNASTSPAVLCGVGGQTAVNLLAPAMVATNGVAPTTTVPTDNSTVITAATTGVANQPYVFLT